jgi:hypothetical protein
MYPYPLHVPLLRLPKSKIVVFVSFAWSPPHPSSILRASGTDLFVLYLLTAPVTLHPCLTSWRNAIYARTRFPRNRDDQRSTTDDQRVSKPTARAQTDLLRCKAERPRRSFWYLVLKEGVRGVIVSVPFSVQIYTVFGYLGIRSYYFYIVLRFSIYPAIFRIQGRLSTFHLSAAHALHAVKATLRGPEYLSIYPPLGPLACSPWLRTCGCEPVD